MSDASAAGTQAAAEPAPSTARRSGHYSRVAIAFHWTIALCIAGQIALGWRLHDLAGPAKFSAYQLHKSIGLTILVLSLGRLAWRLLNPPPREIPLPRWQAVASTAVHTGLYAIMIGLPLTGWLMVSTSRIAVPTRVFGILPWPAIPGAPSLGPAARQTWNAVGGQGHVILVWTTVALLVLHIGAVVKHQVIDRDVVFARMAPGARPGASDWRFWTIAALALAAFVTGRAYFGRTPEREAPRGAAPTARPTAALPAVTAAPAIQPVAPPTAPQKVDVPAAPRAWTVRSGTLGFATDWSGDPVTGSFAKWTADIAFSPEALDRSAITVRIDLASVSTGDAQRDGALPAADWFDVASHRYAVFKSRRVRSTGGSAYAADGTLDLRGVERAAVLPFTVRITGDRATARGSLKIDRTAFGVGQGDWATTDQIPADVRVSFSLAATAPQSPQPAPAR